MDFSRQLEIAMQEYGNGWSKRWPEWATGNGKVKACTPIRMKREIHDFRLKERKIIRLGSFVGGDEKTKHQCLICDHEFLTKPNNITSGGHGCPRCARQRSNRSCRHSQEQYIKNCLELSVRPLEDYRGSGSAILHECIKCGHQWRVTIGNIRHAGGCPGCRSQSKLGQSIWRKRNLDT
ncbi:hypothetical protein AB733_03130 [Photobacterium swingsii]|uniref:zinc-ribbon domain-containing protein n=1 Tax=Photobacterium swingsii TaxID=680026 RepID=UPI000662200E|nr:hypothetical protein [Photobacterium swingsii]KMV31786.1 hypothetical protein AB733_03130 [Photobacterium swingsii]